MYQEKENLILILVNLGKFSAIASVDCFGLVPEM